MKDTVLAWHFVGSTLRDGRPVPPDGVPLIHTGPVQICRSGLHASVRVVDALKYAPNTTICRVQCAAPSATQDDKIVSTERTILWRVDGLTVLPAFAHECAARAAAAAEAAEQERILVRLIEEAR